MAEKPQGMLPDKQQHTVSISRNASAGRESNGLDVDSHLLKASGRDLQTEQSKRQDGESWLQRLSTDWKLTLVVRIFAILSAIVAMLTYVGSIPQRQPPIATCVPPAAEDEALIILAPFAGGVGGKELHPEWEIRDALLPRVRQANERGAHIRVEECPEPVHTSREARALGERHNATLVIWGEMSDLGVRSRVAIIKPPTLLERMGERLRFTVEKREELELCVLVELPAQATYLTFLSLGLAELTQERWTEARGYFGQAIGAVPPGGECQTDASEAYYWRGWAYAEEERYQEAAADYDEAIHLNEEFRQAFAARGIARYILGQYDRSLADFQRALLLTPTGDLQGQAVALGNIGIIYQAKGNLDQALSYYQQAFDIAKRSDYFLCQANVLGNMGVVYQDKGDLDQALSCHQKALAIHKQIGYLQGQADQLGNMGLIHQRKSDLNQALSYYQQALNIDKQSGHLQGQAIILGNIGLMYQVKGDLNQALSYHQQALDIYRQIGYLQGQAASLAGIGLIYQRKGDLDRALSYHQQALSIDEQIGYLQGQAIVLGNIGNTYYLKGDLDQALTHYQQALSIDRQISYLRGQAIQLTNIGRIYADRGQTEEARVHWQQALEMFEAMGSPYADKVRKWLDELEE